jgi:tripeptide aminopeptidase
MTAKINRDRLADIFGQLVGIDSVSREEAAVADRIRRALSEELGLEVVEDASQEQTGSDSGNIIVRIPGEESVESLFFNAHMDTVEPGRGVRASFKDGVFSSDGTTILGADNKAAVAVLIEVARVLAESDVPHGPIEFLFTVCEEIGLLGAKAVDPSLLRARAGYALDSNDPDVLINRAPSAVRFKLKLIGKAAHAGLHPEEGINAITLAARALVEVPQGRIDEDTTANIGLIRGGQATNIVPETVEIDGEVRSHDLSRLREVQDDIIGRFHRVVREFEMDGDRTWAESVLPLIRAEVFDDYPVMIVPEEHFLIVAAMRAAERLGRNLRLARTGGGSDANVFNGKGLATVIMGIGMQKVHTTGEFIRLDDMAATAELVLEILKGWGR